MLIFPLKFLYRSPSTILYFIISPSTSTTPLPPVVFCLNSKSEVMTCPARTVLQTSQSLPPAERRHQSYQVSEGEGEGDQHQGEDEAKEKEPNVEFLLSSGSQTETASCLHFPGLTGCLYPHVLRGEFFCVISNCFTLSPDIRAK